MSATRNLQSSREAVLAGQPQECEAGAEMELTEPPL